MNEADPSPINLDELRMLPDWLREDGPPPAKQYAGHDYPGGDEGNRRGDRRPGGFEMRGPRPERRGPGGPPDRRREGGPRSGPPPRDGGSRGARDDRRNSPAPPAQPSLPAPVRIEFLPDDRCLASINKQIRTTHLAYPLFGLARMFLQEPARHFVQFKLLADAPEGTSLHQLGEDGIVTLDRAILERQAFESAKDRFYVEESVQKEPLKGNFTNVARERLSGTLLGPTNYHAYQPALRALYEARYSRRMSFEDFRRNIEVTTDPSLIEKWKEDSRTSTTIRTRVAEGETPVVLGSPADTRAHFRQHHLDALVQDGSTFRVHGSIARTLPEPAMMQAIREAHDQEMRYPAQFVQLLRQGLQNAGLHIFKHRKRVVYVSLARPTPFVAQGAVSAGLAAILETIAQNPLCTRKALAERMFAHQFTLVEAAAAGLPVAKQEPEMISTVAEARSQSAPTAEASSAEPIANAAPEVATGTISGEHATGAAPGGPGAANEAALPTPSVPPSAPEAPVSRPPADPAVIAKAALAANLRFLVQAGHIIEFHNGTFDLPLPPKSKEEETAARASGKAAKNKQQGEARPTPTSFKPVPGTAVNVPKEGTTFVATGAGVEDGVSELTAGEQDETLSLQEAIEPAPTAANLEADALQPSANEESDESIVIEPGFKPDGTMPPAPDKSDHDGLISGAGAAPMDLPVPGDTENASVSPA